MVGVVCCVGAQSEFSLVERRFLCYKPENYSLVTLTLKQRVMNAKSGQGWTETRHVEGKIVETAYHGKILPEHLDEIRAALDVEFRKIGGGDWLLDTTKASGLRAAPSEASTAFFDSFRRAGGRRIAAVVGSSPLRMLGSAVAFATGHDIKLFATREEALKYLRTTAP